MKAHVKRIIDAMDSGLRAKAEAAARKAGKSLADFVDDSVSGQLSDEQLDSIRGGALSPTASPSPSVRGTMQGDRLIIGYGGNF